MVRKPVLLPPREHGTHPSLTHLACRSCQLFETDCSRKTRCQADTTVMLVFSCLLSANAIKGATSRGWQVGVSDHQPDVTVLERLHLSGACACACVDRTLSQHAMACAEYETPVCSDSLCTPAPKWSYMFAVPMQGVTVLAALAPHVSC